jgi:hypothetical protein
MRTTTALRHALKSKFVPFMLARGFDLDQRNAPQFLEFRRTQGDEMQFVEIQWEKYGRPRFKVTAGFASQKGVICHGKQVEATEVGTGQAPRYVALYPTGNGSSTRHWFRQDKSLISALVSGNRLYPPEETVEKLILLYQELEDYFCTREPGAHCRTHVNAWSQNAA